MTQGEAAAAILECVVVHARLRFLLGLVSWLGSSAEEVEQGRLKGPSMQGRCGGARTSGTCTRILCARCAPPLNRKALLRQRRLSVRSSRAASREMKSSIPLHSPPTCRVPVWRRRLSGRCSRAALRRRCRRSWRSTCLVRPARRCGKWCGM